MTDDGGTETMERPGRCAAPSSARADLIVRSVGTATPRAAAGLAESLGLPDAFVVDTIYRAPARLLANIVAQDAEQLATMLRGIGLDIVAVAPGTIPARGAVLDIAAVLTDPLRADAVAAALARFLGMTADAALDLLLTPPGIVLGNVTQPTLDALHAALPEDAVELTAADPETARYALFASGLSTAQQNAVRPLLASDAALQPDGSIACFDLTRIDADALWRRLRAPQGVRIVNQDFLRFTLALTAMPNDATAGAAALEALAAVPPDVYPAIAALLPCPIVERVAYGDVAARLAAFTASGFDVRADLESFAPVALDVRAAPPGALEQVGLAGETPCVTPPLPREQARVLRARLEALGAEVLPA